jgi:hypothetical protein
MPKGNFITQLPPVTSEVVSASISLFGGVLANVILYHLAHFCEDARAANATKAIDLARRAVTDSSIDLDNGSARANTRVLVLTVINDIEGMVRHELARKSGQQRKD